MQSFLTSHNTASPAFIFKPINNKVSNSQLDKMKLAKINKKEFVKVPNCVLKHSLKEKAQNTKCRGEHFIPIKLVSESSLLPFQCKPNCVLKHNFFSSVLQGTIIYLQWNALKQLRMQWDITSFTEIRCSTSYIYRVSLFYFWVLYSSLTVLYILYKGV